MLDILIVNWYAEYSWEWQKQDRARNDTEKKKERKKENILKSMKCWSFSSPYCVTCSMVFIFFTLAADENHDTGKIRRWHLTTSYLVHIYFSSAWVCACAKRNNRSRTSFSFAFTSSFSLLLSAFLVFFFFHQCYY